MESLGVQYQADVKQIIHLKNDTNKTLRQKRIELRENITPYLPKDTKLLKLQATKNKLWNPLKSLVEKAKPQRELWGKRIKLVESIFGTGTASYFIFIKRLMFINLATFIVYFVFLILPTILGDGYEKPNCTQQNNDFHILNLVQGTGWMETTPFFYGLYSTKTIEREINEQMIPYHLPLAYVCVTIICFLVSLLWIVREAATGFQDNLNDGKGKFYIYCNLIFSSWDFSIDNDHTADNKMGNIARDIDMTFQIDDREDNRKKHIRNNANKVIAFRVVTNFIVFATLGGAATAIFFAFKISNDKLHQAPPTEVEEAEKRALEFDTGGMEMMMYEFLPSICIVLLNLIVPNIFEQLKRFEFYDPEFSVRIALIRTIFLRLFSLFVLYATLYMSISCDNKDPNQRCNKPACWETFVGQQMYRLAITDLATHLVMTFIVNFTRAKVADIGCVSFVQRAQFNLPKNVLDIVYQQTICWFGSFYAPLLPLMFSIIFYIMFHIKLFVCLVNSQRETVLYRASRSNAMFMVVLLVCFITAILPVSFAIGELKPSTCCGPFRDADIVWEVVSDGLQNSPQFIIAILDFISIGGVTVALLVILALTIYYYAAIISANESLIYSLKQQLKLEGQDKQYVGKRCRALERKQREENAML